MASREKDEELMARYEAECAALAAQLAAIRFVWPGTIQWRMMTCGKPACACHADPSMRHGPYPYWTSKKAQKTVSILLNKDEASVYEDWIANRRRLEKIVEQIKRLSRKAAKAALRLQARRGAEERGEV
jgi:hypothetical protein